MLKIVEVHPGQSAQSEYVVLQNQGVMTVDLRGWALCTDAYLTGDPGRMADEMYIFREAIPIKPYTRVVLFTGIGENGWVPTIDGKQAYCAYWNRSERVWSRSANVHVLHVFNSKKVIPAHPIAAPSPA
jgi:hypothetical protein